MTWVKLDDAFFRNPKVTAVQPLGRLLYMAGLCHCADTLSDGEIASRDLPLLYLQSGATAKHVGQLVDAALWVRHGDSYWVPDFLAYNPSREMVLKQREAGKVRANRSRTNRAGSREVTAGVRATPAPSPSPLVSSTDYENNAVREPFAVKPPVTDIRSKIRGSA